MAAFLTLGCVCVCVSFFPPEQPNHDEFCFNRFKARQRLFSGFGFCFVFRQKSSSSSFVGKSTERNDKLQFFFQSFTLMFVAHDFERRMFNVGKLLTRIFSCLDENHQRFFGLFVGRRRTTVFSAPTTRFRWEWKSYFGRDVTLILTARKSTVSQTTYGCNNDTMFIFS